MRRSFGSLLKAFAVPAVVVAASTAWAGSVTLIPSAGGNASGMGSYATAYLSEQPGGTVPDTQSNTLPPYFGDTGTVTAEYAVDADNFVRARASGAATSFLDTDNLGSLTISSTNEIVFGGVIPPDAAVSQYSYTLVFQVEGDFVLDGSFAAGGDGFSLFQLSSIQLTAMDPPPVNYAILTSSSSFYIPLGTGLYALNFYSELIGGSGDSTHAASATVNISSASPVPLPASAVMGTAFLGALALGRKR